VANAKSHSLRPRRAGRSSATTTPASRFPPPRNTTPPGLCNVSPANTNPKVTDRGYPEVNRICGRDDVQGAVGAQYAKSQGHQERLRPPRQDRLRPGHRRILPAEAKTLGIKVVGFAGTEEKANFDAILSPILAAKPQVIYFGGMFDQSAVLFKQARQKGFKGMFLSDDGFDSSDAAKIGGDALLQGAGTYFSTVAGPRACIPAPRSSSPTSRPSSATSPSPSPPSPTTAPRSCSRPSRTPP
jgi:ABC-type branched-subunit amino acid transport system substrate-binding protein